MPFTARTRHIVALQASLTALESAAGQLTAGAPAELVAEELRAAHQSLGEIVGETTPDDLLGRIFSEFCIGKWALSAYFFWVPTPRFVLVNRGLFSK